MTDPHEPAPTAPRLPAIVGATVLPHRTHRASANRNWRRRLLLIAVGCHATAGLLLSVDGIDLLLSNSNLDPFDPRGLLLIGYLGWPALLALAGTWLPGRGSRRAAVGFGIVGLVLAVLLLPLYGLGLLVLPGAVLAFWAAFTGD